VGSRAEQNTNQGRLSQAERELPLPLWTQEVAKRIIDLEERTCHLLPTECGEVGPLLDAATQLVVTPMSRWKLRTRLSNWWTGARVEAAWAHLHEAELRLVEYGDERGMVIALDSALAYAEVLDLQDPRRVRLARHIASKNCQPTAQDPRTESR